MTDYKRFAFGTVAAASLIIGGTAPALAAEPASAEGQAPEASLAQEGSLSADVVVKADALQGEFSWNQTEITPNSVIAKMFRNAAASLCGSTVDFVADNPLGWKIAVTGDVQNAFTASVDDLASEESVEQAMTCTCASNPSDGAAIINADVKGIPVTALLDMAQPVEGANVVTFISSDGTTNSIPLGYVIGRHAVISYEINGEDLSASVGGNNQLWMTRTAASYFTRDIVEVRITKEETLPANPGDGLEYPNSPNAGISSSSVE